VKRILIVDDSFILRRTLRILLEQRSDWSVCGEAENGCEGIDKAQELKPDLIVMDLAMPLLNGIDASRMLKRLLPATPIVMFTTFTEPHIQAAALAAGVHTVVSKSEGATTLVRRIQTLLADEMPPPCAA
jgi:DNA-binding NarL/FixJ family response regulator